MIAILLLFFLVISVWINIVFFIRYLVREVEMIEKDRYDSLTRDYLRLFNCKLHHTERFTVEELEKRLETSWNKKNQVKFKIKKQ